MLKVNWRYIEIAAHVIVWSMYFILMEFGLGTFWDQFERYHVRTMVITFPAIFYMNAFILIPLILKKRKWVIYFLSIPFLLLITEVVRAGIASLFGSAQFFTNISLSPFHNRSLMDIVFVGLILSSGYKFTKDWVLNLTLINRLKAENISRELAFLKSQVDPHFLFNTLNSLYALALEENSEKTADGIVKLSTLMRYNLHDSQTSKIPIKKEIDYIDKYIALQRLRASKRNDISFEVKLGNNELEIAPMLLIPFVENAFKYGLNPIEDAFIQIVISVVGNDLSLKITNSISNKVSVESSGIGQQNVKDRLEMLYPNSHRLAINEHNNEYHVQLQINLSK